MNYVFTSSMIFQKFDKGSEKNKQNRKSYTLTKIFENLYNHILKSRSIKTI